MAGRMRGGRVGRVGITEKKEDSHGAETRLDASSIESYWSGWFITDDKADPKVHLNINIVFRFC